MLLYWIIVIVLLNGCTRHNQEPSKLSTENLDSKEYFCDTISMTITHATEQSDSFQSDVILLDTKDYSLKTIASIPYTSQYPLTCYSANQNKVYYTACAKDNHGDEIFSYDCVTGKTTQLTDNFFAINYLYVTENGLFINAVLQGDSDVVQPFFYDFQSEEINDLSWDDDFYVRSAGKNENSSRILVAGHSNKAKEEIFDQGDIIGIDNYIYMYTLPNLSRTEILHKSNCYIDSVTMEDNILVYRIRNQIFNPTYTTYVRNLETGEENTIEINDGKSIGEFVGLKDNELYYVTTDYVGEDSSSNLCKINLHNGKTSIIYQTELKQCINNAQFVTW